MSALITRASTNQTSLPSATDTDLSGEESWFCAPPPRKNNVTGLATLSPRFGRILSATLCRRFGQTVLVCKVRALLSALEVNGSEDTMLG